MDAPDLTLPQGFTARNQTPDDSAAVTELIAAAELAEDGVIEIDPEDIVSGFGRAGFDLSDTLLVFDHERPVAAAEVYQGRAEADVHPDVRSRGIGSAILGWTEERARSKGRPVVRQTVTDANTGARELLQRRGYRIGHLAWILQIAFDDGPPPAADPPPGIAIRKFDAERDAQAAHRLIEDAFNEWDGREPQTFEEWRPWLMGHGAFAPTLSPLAFDGDELVGAALSFDYASLDEGWIQQLATKASHRHRGIARALLQTAFGAFYDRGKTRSGLSTDSRTGALSLYERVGMRVRRSYTSCVKELGTPDQ